MCVIMEIEHIWNFITNYKYCDDCPLRGISKPILLKFKDRVNVMVITEGPNEEADPEFIASIANHPTFTFLQAIFQGRLHVLGEKANAYWTHMRKCFIKTKSGQRLISRKSEGRALRICSRSYLLSEIKCVKPKLIVAVGRRAANFFSKYDYRLAGRIEELVFKGGGIFDKVAIEGLATKIIVVPHPSGRSTIWTNLPENAREVIERISQEIVESLES